MLVASVIVHSLVRQLQRFRVCSSPPNCPQFIFEQGHRWQLLDQVNVGGVKYYVRQIAGRAKDQTGQNEHVPPNSYTGLWADNCTDNRLLSLNLSAAGPNPTRYNREISECGSGA